MHDIFLSYAKEDKDYARTIAQALEKEGFDVWWDHDIPTGTNWASVIEKAIDDTKCVIVLWSKHSISSEWVQVEATEGQKRNMLIPVRIEDVEIPLAFRMRQTADLINWNKKHTDPLFERLLVDIRAIIQGSHTDEIKDSSLDRKSKDGGTNRKGFIDSLKYKTRIKPNKIIGFVIIIIVFIIIGIFGWPYFFRQETTNLESFSEPPEKLQPPFNSNEDDLAFYIDSEINTGFITSNRPYGMGGYDIYTFLEEKFYDPRNNELIESESVVQLSNLNTNTQFADLGGIYVNDKFYWKSERMISDFNWKGEYDIFEASVIKDKGDIIISEISSINTSFLTDDIEGSMTLTKDGKIMYFARNEYGYDKLKEETSNIINIYSAIFLKGQWTLPEKLSFNIENWSTSHPRLSPDDKQLFFVSDRPGGLGKTDIYVVDILPDKKFSTPQNLGKYVNTKGYEMFPFIDKNHTLYFSSDGFENSDGKFDIYKSNILKEKVD